LNHKDTKITKVFMVLTTKITEDIMGLNHRGHRVLRDHRDYYGFETNKNLGDLGGTWRLGGSVFRFTFYSPLPTGNGNWQLRCNFLSPGHVITFGGLAVDRAGLRNYNRSIARCERLGHGGGEATGR
jgi:hypothetical protein